MMFINPARFGTLIAPIPGTITALLDANAASWDTKTFTGATGHTSATGNILVFVASRSNSGPSLTITGVTWDGNPLTPISSGSLTGVGRALCWCGWIRGSTTGARDIVVTASAVDARRCMGYAIDLDRMAASPIGHAPAAVVTNVVQSVESVTITPTNPNSLLLGFTAALAGGINPMSVNAVDGWSELANSVTGAAGGNDICGILGSRPAGNVTARTFSGVSDALTTTDDWAAMGFEVLPA